MSLERALKEEKELESIVFQSDESQTQQNTEDVSSESTENVDNFSLNQPPEKETLGSTGDEDSKKSSWKERFSSYKAATDKTISNLRKDNSLLGTKLSEYERKIDELSYKVVELSAKGRDPFSEVITKEDIDTIGPEAIDIVKKATKKIAEFEVSSVKKELEELKAKEASRVWQDGENKRKGEYNGFLSELQGKVPDYQTIDHNPKFAEFLNTIDPYSGELRMDLFRRSESYLDANRVADFFLEFKEAQPRSKKELLEEKITPEGSKSTPNPIASNNKETISSSEVEKFYNDITRGLYKNKKKEADEIEARITKAYMEGRIM